MNPPDHAPRNPAGLTRPSLHAETSLPIYDLGSRRFEELCLELVRIDFPELVRASLKRKTGQAQFGVDVEGFDETHRPVVVVLAKCYRSVPPAKIRAWADDFLKHVGGHWKGRGVRIFVMAITRAYDDDDLNDAVTAAAKRVESVGIKFRLWNLASMCRLIEERKVLVGRFFGPARAEAFLGRVATASLADLLGPSFPTGGSAAQQALVLVRL